VAFHRAVIHAPKCALRLFAAPASATAAALMCCVPLPMPRLLLLQLTLTHPLPRPLPLQLCYYQALEFAIERGLQRVEAGAQGEHKLQASAGCSSGVLRLGLAWLGLHTSCCAWQETLWPLLRFPILL